MRNCLYTFTRLLLVAVLGSFQPMAFGQVYAKGTAPDQQRTSHASAQERAEDRRSVSALLFALEESYHVSFNYDDAIIRDLTLEKDFSWNKDETLEAVLLRLTKLAGLRFEKVSVDNYLIFLRRKEANTKTGSALITSPNGITASADPAIESLQYVPSARVAVHQVSGTVKDETNNGLPGVNVILKGTTNGTTTDAEGKYVLSLADGSGVLVFSFIGYESREVPVNNQSVIDISMSPDVHTLEEVVVVGYGEVKKRDLTGAVASVKGEEITRFPVTTVVEALQGKIAGADITRTNGYAGGGSTIRIRGNRSIANPNSSNTPLYIVDGVQGVDASVINPNDIETIDVLKDASSTAIYGSRGANGVIIITTKRGTGDKPQFNFNSYAGFSEVAGYGKFMDGPQYVAFRREAYRSVGTWNSPDDDSKIFTPQMLTALQNGEYTSWPELLINNGVQQDYQLGVAGGSEKTKIYFSGDYFNEKGVLKNDEYKRYTGRVNLDQTINNRIKAGIQTQLVYTDNDQRRDPFNAASKIAPVGLPYDADGNLILFPGQGTEVNPLADEQPGAWRRNRQIINGTLAGYLEVKPLKDLSLRSTFSATLQDEDYGHFNAKETIDGKGSSSSSQVTQARNLFTSWENLLVYNKAIKDHTFTITGVASRLSWRGTSSYAGGNNQAIESQYYHNLSGASQNMYMGSNFIENTLISFTGRVNYGWRGKYLLTLTSRTDGSSKLGTGNKWAFFPSAALGWRIIDENFMKTQNLMSELKLRVSYGISGNDVIAPYTTQNSLALIQYSYDDSNPAMAYGLSPTIGNPDLKWELTTTKDIGVDFGILENRITGSVDYYDALTSDLIFPYTLPLATGVSTVYRNIGKTRNRGIEVQVTTRNIVRNNFSWSTDFTFFSNREAIVHLPNGNVIDNDYRRSLIKGQPAQIFYDYKKIGIWQLGEEAEAEGYAAIPGDVKIADLSGPDGVPDGKITPDDRTVIGTTVPQWSGGMNNQVRYKGFDLNVFLFARIGQWASSDYIGKYRPDGNNNNPLVDYWTPENPTNAFPRPHTTRRNAYITTLTLFESSFVKVRNITLGYTLPKSLSRKFGVDNLRLYVSGKNLFSFTKHEGFDPESGGIIDQPLNKLYVGGLNLTF